jgi:hypothetical protein
VRSVQGCVEAAAEDITIRTTLMEARYLAGSRRLFSDLLKALEETNDPLSFFKAKKLEQEQRHAKHQDTPYSLEPNLKEAPGGLRDLHTIMWIARASGIGRRWSDLVSAGLLERHEAASSRATRLRSRTCASACTTSPGAARTDRVRLPERPRGAVRRRRHTRAASERSDDAALLPRGQDVTTAQHHRAAEHRAAALSACRGEPTRA